MSAIYNELDLIFHPRSIAFVGISLNNPFHWTRTFWYSARAFNYEGQIYPVNPAGGELDGCKVYRSLDEVPGDIDYVIGTVAAAVAPEIVRKCAGRGVRAVHFCTAGFDETGEKDSAGLQAELTGLAQETGIRVIGPNCMGIYCPESRLSFDADFAHEAGSIGLISQSGGNAIYIVREANWRGVRFSKVVSFGNACDLNESDFLEYMIEDPQTRVIALYLEGVKDGRRFARLIERAAREKTVVLIKGGLGEAGARATASHTASLAGSDATWDALCRQFNLIRVKNVEELVDILTTLYFLPDPGGRKLVLIGPGGGASVLLTDEFERRGLRLPPLPDVIRRKLLGFTQLAGNMLRNPIDYSQTMMQSDSLGRAVEILTDWDEIDLCVGFFRPSQFPPSGLEFIFKIGGSLSAAYHASHKPLAYICESAVTPDGQKAVFELVQKFAEARVPVYYSFAAAAEAISTVVKYNERRQSRM